MRLVQPEQAVYLHGSYSQFMQLIKHCTESLEPFQLRLGSTIKGSAITTDTLRMSGGYLTIALEGLELRLVHPANNSVKGGLET